MMFDVSAEERECLKREWERLAERTKAVGALEREKQAREFWERVAIACARSGESGATTWADALTAEWRKRFAKEPTQ